MGSHWVGRGPGRAVHPETARRVRALVAEGATDAEIGEALECSDRLARAIRLALGLVRGPTPAAPVPDERIRGLHAEGMATWRIAATVGQTAGTIAHRLSGMGLKANRSEGGQRSKQVSTWMTHEEHERIAWKAEQEGHASVSAWLRSLMGFEV